MTITTEEVRSLVADRWPSSRLTTEPTVLPGGFWASMFRVGVTGQPDGVPAELVLRISPDAAMGAKELAVQQVVAEQGYPTPAIHASGTDAAGRPWALMDFIEGRPLLDGLDGLAAVRRAPRLLLSMPVVMATALAGLHRLDPAPITAAVREVAPSVAWDVDDVLGHFRTGAELLERPELTESLGRLVDRRPAGRPTVVCHGDYHPFNLLTDADGTTTVLDWTGALCAEPAYDVAFTVLLLSNPPLEARGLVGSALRGAGRLMARRFLAAYRRANPTADLSNLDWYRALGGARIILESARLEATPNAGSGHPFAAMLGPATAALDL